MKIALIYCSGGLNIGNEFINAGATWLLRNLFPDAHIASWEFFDSALANDYRHPSAPLTPSTRAAIEDFDVAVVCGGSIISHHTWGLLEYFASLPTPTVLLGAGCWQFNADEQALCSELAEMFAATVMRDSVSYSFAAEAENTFEGIDLAFFADRHYACAEEPGNYGVVNLDKIAQHEKAIRRERRRLLKRYPEAYVVENTHTPYRDVPGYLFLSYGRTFYGLYANAGEVVTNRVHTSVCCATNQTPFQYKGGDAGGQTGRNTLFNVTGLTLDRGRSFSSEELAGAQPRINEGRKRMAAATRLAIEAALG